MSKVFYINEILNFAIEKEQESYDLYKKMSELSTDSKMKELFKDLMSQETRHKMFFTDLLNHIKDEHADVVEGDMYEAYMRELIRQSRTTPSLSSINVNDRNQALDFGIDREKDSILFYTGLKNFIKEESKAMIEVIIKEEARHLVMLTKMKSSI